MPSSHPQVIQTKAPIQSETPLVRIPIEPHDLDKIPEAFRGIMYETASHMVGHAYKASAKDLRAIEEHNPEDVLESTIGMNLTSVLAQYRSIARVKARNEELRAALIVVQENEQVARAALSVTQESEHASKAAIISSQEGE
ncbi:uncharacterized protein LOC133789918 [Humulus lupulus]|uniref:uncharacterized protein LOC133789918 n=1 Tax=Humulus lupulus TaxID=3486 RepID=UPI002B40B817|nr:uncharacterized protein LOC133789918 [Humulus lupulus]